MITRSFSTVVLVGMMSSMALAVGPMSVPEPTSLGLLGFGLLVGAGLLRKKFDR